jgi:hypothetical protein
MSSSRFALMAVGFLALSLVGCSRDSEPASATVGVVVQQGKIFIGDGEVLELTEDTVKVAYLAAGGGQTVKCVCSKSGSCKIKKGTGSSDFECVAESGCSGCSVEISPTKTSWWSWLAAWFRGFF